jgi:CubicO group peptidase (beta-lactamase class C family)
MSRLIRAFVQRRAAIRAQLLLTLFLCGLSVDLLAGGAIGTGEKSEQVDQLFSVFTTGIQPGAAVMVIRNGIVVHSKGYGYADLDKATPITPASTFRLGSVSKQFTAMAIAILADNGKLDYSDRVSKYVPALVPYKDVTIRHLLTHTSGLPDYYDEFDVSPWVEEGSLPSNADAMAYEGKMARLLFPPGERYEYSNPAYEALPLIVEAVSGQEFSTFMGENVFQPIGMDGSLIHDHHRPQINQRVLGYSQTSDGYELYDDDPLNGITGSGGQYSTLEDFFDWDQALYVDTLVSSDTLKQVFTRARLNSGEEIDYGFGWRLDSYKGHERIAHGGSWVGFKTAISRYPGLGLTIVILSNRAEYDPVAVSDQVTDIYLD